MKSYSIRKSTLVNSMQAVTPLVSRKLDIDHILIKKGVEESLVDIDSSSSDVSRHLINSLDVTFSQSDISAAALELINGTNSGNLVVRLTGNMGNQTIVSSNTLNKNAETIFNDVNNWVASLDIKDVNLSLFVKVVIQHAIVKAFSKAGLLSNFSKSVSAITVKESHVVPSTIDMVNDVVIHEMCNIADIIISAGIAESPRQKCSKGDISQFILIICRKLADELHKLLDLYSTIGLLLSVIDYSIENVFSYDLFYPSNDINLAEVINEVHTCFNFLYVSGVDRKTTFIKPLIRVDNTTKTASFVHEVAYRFPAVKALFKKLLTMYQSISLAELRTSLCYSFNNDIDNKLQSITMIDPVRSAYVPQLLSGAWLTVSPIPKNTSFRAVLPSAINEAFDHYSIYSNIQSLISSKTLSDCYNELARFKSETSVDNRSKDDTEVIFSTISNLSIHDEYAFKLALAMSLATETILVPNSIDISYDKSIIKDSDAFKSVVEETDKLISDSNDGERLTKFNLLLSRGNYSVFFKIGPDNSTMIRNAFDSLLHFPSGSYTQLVESVLSYFIPKQGFTSGVMSSDNTLLSSIISNIPAKFNPNLTILSTHNIGKKDIRAYQLNNLSLSIATLSGTSQGKFNNLQMEIDLGTISLMTPGMDDFTFLTNFGCYSDFNNSVSSFLSLIEDLMSTVKLIKSSNILHNSNSIKSAVIKRVLDPLFRSLKTDNSITAAVETYIANESYRLAYNSEIVSDYVRQDILGGIDALLSSNFGSTRSVLTFMLTCYFMLAFTQHTATDYKNIKELVNVIIEHTVVSFR